MLDTLYYQSTLINIIPGLLSNKVIDLLKDISTRSFFLPQSPLLAGLKPDVLIRQGPYPLPTPLLL